LIEGWDTGAEGTLLVVLKGVKGIDHTLKAFVGLAAGGVVDGCRLEATQVTTGHGEG